MTSSQREWHAMLVCLVLSGLTLVTFWPVTGHEFINFDDPDYVSENPRVLAGLNWNSIAWAFGTSHTGNWHPLTWLSHILDCQVFGLQPGHHHLMNLLLHTASTLLLFLVLNRMTAALWRSAFVATLFAVHPLHVESVAWVAERKDVLSTFFGMLTLYAYARYCEELKARTAKVKVFYTLALLLFALGLMCKPMLVTWPFVLLLLDFWPLHRLRHEPGSRPGRDFLRLAWEKVPFLCLTTISSIVTFLVQDKGSSVISIGGLPLAPRLINAFASYLKYLGKMIWPANLAIFYPHPDIWHPASGRMPLWEIAAAVLLLTAISAFAALRLKRQPWLAMGWLWYLITLAPVIGIVQVGTQAMADRYSYVPLIGVFICLVWGIAELIAHRRRGQPWLAAIGVAVVITCVAVTRQQLTHWRNSVVLFEHALAVTNDNSLAHFNLGTALGRQGKFEEALAHFRTVVQAQPSYVDVHYSMGLSLSGTGKYEEAVKHFLAEIRQRPAHVLARNNLGTALWMLGKPDQALLEYAEVIRLKPNDHLAHFNMGTVLSNQRRFADAAAHFAEAVRHKPDYAEARTGLASALAAQGKLGEAGVQLRELVRLFPKNVEAQINLGNLLMELGHTQEAKACFSNVLQLAPDAVERYVQEGKLLAAQGKVDAAAARFTTAVRLKEDTPDAHENLGLLRAQQGRLDEAVAHLKQVLQLRPDAQAQYHMGLALSMLGKSEDAVSYFTQAVRLKPDWPEALDDLAWILATHPQAKARNGREAVRLAERACQLSGGKVARFWGTLDASYAEAGRFADAVKAAEKGRELALMAGQKEIADAADRRLILYRKQRPYHQQAATKSFQ